jgi:hypothetical protein
LEETVRTELLQRLQDLEKAAQVVMESRRILSPEEQEKANQALTKLLKEDPKARQLWLEQRAKVSKRAEQILDAKNPPDPAGKPIMRDLPPAKHEEENDPLSHFEVEDAERRRSFTEKLRQANQNAPATPSMLEQKF